MPGCPIRKSTDQFVCADPRSLSQLITSFVASESLGIHRLPLSVFAPKMLQVAYPHPGCILTYLICSTLFSRLFLSSMSMIAFGYLRRITPLVLDSSRSRGLSYSSLLGALAVAPWGVSSFAVAKVRRKTNTNQISRRKRCREQALSAIHYPLKQQITGAKSFFSHPRKIRGRKGC